MHTHLQDCSFCKASSCERRAVCLRPFLVDSASLLIPQYVLTCDTTLCDCDSCTSELSQRLLVFTRAVFVISLHAVHTLHGSMQSGGTMQLDLITRHCSDARYSRPDQKLEPVLERYDCASCASWSGTVPAKSKHGFGLTVG